MERGRLLFLQMSHTELVSPFVSPANEGAIFKCAGQPLVILGCSSPETRVPPSSCPVPSRPVPPRESGLFEGLSPPLAATGGRQRASEKRCPTLQGAKERWKFLHGSRTVCPKGTDGGDILRPFLSLLHLSLNAGGGAGAVLPWRPLNCPGRSRLESPPDSGG